MSLVNGDSKTTSSRTTKKMTGYGDLVRSKMSELTKRFPTWKRIDIFKRAVHDVAEDTAVRYARNHIMASRIKRAFRRSMSDPNYRMCRDRLAREFECLVNGDSK